MFERYILDCDRQRYGIFDVRYGRGGNTQAPDMSRALVTGTDPEIMQRIVRLLNADAAQLERQGARVA